MQVMPSLKFNWRLLISILRIDRIQHYKILPEQFEDRNFKIQDYFTAYTYEDK